VVWWLVCGFVGARLGGAGGAGAAGSGAKSGGGTKTGRGRGGDALLVYFRSLSSPVSHHKYHTRHICPPNRRRAERFSAMMVCPSVVLRLRGATDGLLMWRA